MCVCVCVLHGMPSHTYTRTHTDSQDSCLAFSFLFCVATKKHAILFVVRALCVTYAGEERDGKRGKGRKSCLFKFNNEFNERRVRVQSLLLKFYIVT